MNLNQGGLREKEVGTWGVSEHLREREREREKKREVKLQEQVVYKVLKPEWYLTLKTLN